MAYEQLALTKAEEDYIVTHYKSGLSQTKIAEALGISQTRVSRYLRNNKYPTRWNGKGPNWQGGRRVQDGYVLIWTSPDDKFASMRSSVGYIMEHRYVMATKLGRPLEKSETVHHIDGNTLNNDYTNLQLRKGKHGKGVVMHCGDCGSTNLLAVPISD